MRGWEMVALGEVLRRSDEPVQIEPTKEYQEVTVKLWGKGVVSRGRILGSDIHSPRRIVRANQLIISKIDARNGAMGLIPPELDEAVVSTNFAAFNFHEANRCHPSFMVWFVRSSLFVDLCKGVSEGTTNRIYITGDRFLNQKIPLPPCQNNSA